MPRTPSRTTWSPDRPGTPIDECACQDVKRSRHSGYEPRAERSRSRLGSRARRSPRRCMAGPPGTQEGRARRTETGPRLGTRTAPRTQAGPHRTAAVDHITWAQLSARRRTRRSRHLLGEGAGFVLSGRHTVAGASWDTSRVADPGAGASGGCPLVRTVQPGHSKGCYRRRLATSDNISSGIPDLNEFTTDSTDVRRMVMVFGLNPACTIAA